MKRLCIVGMLLSVVAGCGQKGALYLPAKTQHPQAVQQQTVKQPSSEQPSNEKRQSADAVVRP